MVTSKCIYFACSLLLLSNGVRSRPGESLKQISPTNLPAETNETEIFDIRQQAIEDFKSKILESLKISEPPSKNLTNHSLSKEMIELLQEEKKEISLSEPKENMIVYPTNNDFTCERGNETHCSKFDFNITSDIESIITLHAYFHKMQVHKRLTLLVYDPNSLDDDPVIKLREDSVRSKRHPEWISFELPKKLSLGTDNSQLLCSVEIEGSSISTNGEDSPFLVVTKHSEVPERKRREVEDYSSNENCTCCADSYHITLEDIGWENWVYAPKSFNIKVCRGQCTENLSYFTLNYARIIYSFYKLNKALPKPTCNFWGPQCKPENLTSLNMIYKDEDGNIHERNLKDMIIKNCKCL